MQKILSPLNIGIIFFALPILTSITGYGRLKLLLGEGLFESGGQVRDGNVSAS